MTPENKEKWAAALESGNYEQGFGYPREQTGDIVLWSALGVGYDAICPERWLPTIELKGSGLQRWYFDNSDKMTPSEVLGLNIEQINAVIKLNNFQQKSFAEIAKYIREKF